MKRILYLFLILLFTISVLTGCNLLALATGSASTSVQVRESSRDTAASPPVSHSPVSVASDSSEVFQLYSPEDTVEEERKSLDDIYVHFLDVGQGDCIFIELPNHKTMLIDAGEDEYADKIGTYIFNQGYDTLDYVVATHNHSDHIGGMPAVLNNFVVKNIYTSSGTASYYTYNDFSTAAQRSGAVLHMVSAGCVIANETDLLIEVVAPKVINDDEPNNNSIVIKLTYGDNRFLFTGDAEKAEEDSIWTNIKCDVLKIGHHGSNSSTSANFLKKTEPTHAVISCGMHNSYGHPTDAVLKRLADRNIKTYRTDLQGTIVMTSDGKTITVNAQPSDAASSSNSEDSETPVTKSYVLNKNTKKIHYDTCSAVQDIKETNKIFTTDYAAAISNGYKPCKICNPI